MAIQRELWIEDIVENLGLNDSFAKFARQSPAEYIHNKYVHIPQSGADPDVVVDRTSLPATATRRVDDDIVFRIQSLSTDPVAITDQELNFETKDKIRSVLAGHVRKLSNSVHTNLIYSWVAGVTANASAGNAGSATAAASVIRTTGSAIVAHLAGATGNRKGLTYADLRKAKLKLDNQNIPLEGRYALLDPDMESQLMSDPELQGFKNTVSVNNGSGSLAGQVIASFTIIVRTVTGVFNNASTPVIKAVGAASATTDNGVVVCWQMDNVERAMGSVNFFERARDPQYYGNLYSTEIFHGGTKIRKNGDGIVCIVQDAA